MANNEIGSITWADLTVEDADQIRDFYKEVVGWNSMALDMGGYNDYCMNSPGTEQTNAGICHARGGNAGLPPQWLIYITVADLDQSMESCRLKGGKILSGPRDVPGQGRYCVIQDPAGAVAALFQKIESTK